MSFLKKHWLALLLVLIAAPIVFVVMSTLFASKALGSTAITPTIT